MKVDLAGRVALITGSGQGIGEAMAYAFSENGAVIAVNDINPKGVQTATEIEKRGGKAKFYPGDVGDVDVVNAMVAAVENGLRSRSIFWSTMRASTWGRTVTPFTNFSTMIGTGFSASIWTACSIARGPFPPAW